MLRPVMQLSCFHRCSDRYKGLVATFVVQFQEFAEAGNLNGLHTNQESLGGDAPTQPHGDPVLSTSAGHSLHSPPAKDIIPAWCWLPNQTRSPST